MKKTSFIILAILSTIALLAWFSCNPFNVNGKSESSNYSVFDDSGSTRLVITCTIVVNGSTWDGGGITVNPSGFEQSYNDGLGPFMTVTNGTVKNFTASPYQGYYEMDGIWVSGNCSIDNVTYTDKYQDAVKVKKPGTYNVSNCTFNNSEENIIKVFDLCTITTQNVKVDTAERIIRQFGGKTWKMTAYTTDCTFMGIVECIFRSDAPTSTFFYRNLTTNCATIGYPTGMNGVVTKVVPY